MFNKEFDNHQNQYYQQATPNNQQNPPKKRKSLSFFKIYFIVSGIAVNLYILMRLIIELLVILNSGNLNVPL